MTSLTPHENPILAQRSVTIVAMPELQAPVQHIRPSRRDVKRENILLWRQESAEQAIKNLTQEVEIYGFTKGQFSLLDLLKAVLKKTGPAAMDLSTWTANRKETMELAEMKKRGELTSVRWLVDMTFVRRDPEATAAMRAEFGEDAIRVAHCHSKFALFYNEQWQLSLRTSMNLNMNPRTEDFMIANDPDMFGFIYDIMNRIWNLQPKSMVEAKSGDVMRHFQNELLP